MERSHPQATERDLRLFGLVLGAMIAAVLGVIPYLRHRHTHPWVLLIAALLWLIALTAPRGLRRLHRWWTWLGEWLAYANTHIVLTLAFFAVVTPLGLFMKLLGHDPLRRKFEPASESYAMPSTRRERTAMEKPY